jgi:alkylhydroperoxidase/carboxymuconolactone decarboxylase family protein YurZ
VPVADYLNEKGKKYIAQRGKEPRASVFDQADPEFQQLLANFAHNGMYAREVIPPAVRELLCVALLTALHPSNDELAFHLEYALNLNSEAAVMEAILLAGLHGGVPASSNGMKVYREVIERRRNQA